MDRIDPRILRATELRDRALVEAKRWDDFLRMYAELGDDSARLQATGEPQRVRAVSPIRKAVRTIRTDEAAAAIIREKGPFHTKPLLTELEQVGHHVGGKVPSATLHSRLARGALLTFDADHGWKLKGSIDSMSPLSDIPQSELQADKDRPEEGDSSSGRVQAVDDRSF